MATVPTDLASYASQASGLTGLDQKVILAQWISENGWKTPRGYNFGNIMIPGTQTLRTYSSGSEGVTAYANFLKQNSNYKGVLATAGGSAESQLNAIIKSPWDAGHYANGLLTNVYNTLTGLNIPVGEQVGPLTPAGDPIGSTASAPAIGLSNQLVALQGTAQGAGAGWADQAKSIGLMALLAFCGLILLYVGLKFLGGSGGPIIIGEAKSE